MAQLSVLTVFPFTDTLPLIPSWTTSLMFTNRVSSRNSILLAVVTGFTFWMIASVETRAQVCGGPGPPNCGSAACTGLAPRSPCFVDGTEGVCVSLDDCIPPDPVFDWCFCHAQRGTIASCKELAEACEDRCSTLTKHCIDECGNRRREKLVLARPSALRKNTSSQMVEV